MIWLRIAILVLLAYILYRIFRPRKSKDRLGDGKGPISREDVMVQDPWCKAYLPRSQALTAENGEQGLYFCSSECRERYIEERTNGG